MNSARQLLLNTAANWAGQLLPPLLALVMVPLYIRNLGIASYGLIGAFTALTLLLNIFSQGISHALQREFARRDKDEAQRCTMRQLARNFERVYQLIGFTFGLTITIFAGWISNHWIHDPGDLSPDEIKIAVRLLGVRIAIAFPYGVFSAIFVGIQRQVLGNAYVVAFTLLGAITSAILVIVTNSITALYIGEVIISCLMVFAVRRAAYRSLPPADHRERESGISGGNIRSLIRLSSGTVWTSGIGVFISQVDRILLSRMAALAELAVYNAASAGGRLISMVYMPFLTAAFPRTCQLVAAGDRAGLKVHVLQNSTVVASMTAAIGMPVIFFGGDLLWLWTRETLIQDSGASLLAIYTLGTLALSNAAVFYSLLVAVGRVRSAVLYNTFAVVWYPVLMHFLITRAGSSGAAWTWLLYGCGSWIALAISSFRRHLPPQTWVPYLRRVIGPYALATALAATTSVLLHASPLWRGLACALLAVVLLPSAFLIGVGPTEFARMLKRLHSRGRIRDE